MNAGTASYYDEIFNSLSQHYGFRMTHLLWDPMVKTTWVPILLQGTVKDAAVECFAYYCLKVIDLSCNLIAIW